MIKMIVQLQISQCSQATLYIPTSFQPWALGFFNFENTLSDNSLYRVELLGGSHL